MRARGKKDGRGKGEKKKKCFVDPDLQNGPGRTGRLQTRLSQRISQSTITTGLVSPCLATPPGWSLPFRSCDFPSCFCHLCAPCVVVAAVVVVQPNLKPSPAASWTSIRLCDCDETIDYWLWPISQHWRNYFFKLFSLLLLNNTRVYSCSSAKQQISEKQSKSRPKKKKVLALWQLPVQSSPDSALAFVIAIISFFSEAFPASPAQL